MNFGQLLKEIRIHLPMLREQYQVDTLYAFGSYVREEQTATSDFDLLVTFKEKPTLFQFINLENDLSDLLGLKVDLVMPNTLKEPLRDVILESAIAV